MKTDREKLIELINDFSFCFTEEEYYSGKATNERCLEQFADYLISKGGMIPVRCWECKHYTKEPHSCKCELHSEIPDQCGEGFDMQMLEVDFCSYGERKEE